jgi:NitT/TauT family transport system ATP-binding protein
MTQEDTLLPWRTTAGNIGMPLRMRGVPRAEVDGQVDRYLRLLDLEAAKSRFPASCRAG